MRSSAALFTVLLSACGTSALSEEISQAAAAKKGELDLSKVGGPEWERVCFLGPYSGNLQAEKTLGFKWDAEGRTDIEESDSINVLLFVKGDKVLAYTEHFRHQDFWRLSEKCFARSRAVFVDRGEGYVERS